MQQWTDAQAPRIWRCPDSDFSGDEPLHAAEVYTPEVFEGIRGHGFNGVWLRGKLYRLMNSRELPELNDPDREERLRSLRTVIERGREQGVGVYLFFKEPLGLPEDHPFWRQHPEFMGSSYRETLSGRTIRGFCTSAPGAMAFVRQAIQSVLEALPGLAGVILITASEHHSHCWAHTLRFKLDDGVDHGGAATPDCPRCRDREPADIVLELLQAWRDAARAVAPGCRVLAWNWSWSMWYPDPQAEIVGRIPEGVELLVDWERGGTLEQGGRTIVVDEYSLAFPGPSARFLTTQAASPRGTPVHAKLQIGTTHEIATVPNLPLMHALHAKLAGLTAKGVAGTMACWNFGCSLTLNSYAVRQFQRDPSRYQNASAFLNDLGREYLGIEDGEKLGRAWRLFTEAFRDHYPFSIVFLYWSPVNDAPAHPLSLEYRAEKLGPSWRKHDFGDNALSCLGDRPIDEVAVELDKLARRWEEGLKLYEQVFADAPPTDAPRERQRHEELSAARMIGLQMRSATNFFRFHARRLELVGHNEPCSLPPDEALLATMREEIANAEAAIPLLEADPRLGFHQEGQVAMYSPELIRAKVQAMRAELEGVATAVS